MSCNVMKRILSILLCLLLLGTSIPVNAEDVKDSQVTEENTEGDTTLEPEIPEEPEKPEEPEPIPLVVRVKRISTTRVRVSWTSDCEGTYYRIKRAVKGSNKYKKIVVLSGKEGAMSYTDKDLALGTSYCYKVEEIENNKVIESDDSVAVKIRLLPAENVKATLTSNNDVKVTWDKVQYASGYYISRSTSKNGTYKRVGTVSRTTFSFTDKTPANGKTYYYKVRGYRKNNSAANGWLSEAEAKVCYTKPSKPTVTGKYTTSKKVKLSWKKVTGATNYTIYRRNNEGNYVKIGTTKNAYYYDSNVKAKKQYKYKVAAYYKKGGKTLISNKSSVCSVYTSKIDPNKKMVALTFDDGPGPYTQEIVDCLKKNDARATFFVIGNRINTYKSAVKSAYANGNEIANHTYTHPTLTYLSVSGIKSEINKTDNLIKDITGSKAALVRAPGGATNSTVRKNVSKPFIYWSIDTRDWETRSKTATINSVMNNVSDGDIILMHDIHYATKEAALVIIPRLKKAGYQLVTVSEMAESRGYDLKNGTTYYSFR